MPAFSFRYVFRPREASWWVAILFLLVGIGCGLLLPPLFAGDPEADVAVWVLRALGAVFFLIGFVVFLLAALKLPDYVVHTIGGLLGALSFGIPSSFALPLLLLAYDRRPNMFFGADESFTSETRMIGILFTALGVIVTIVTIVLARYQLKNKTLGWSWSWNTDDSKK